MSSTTFVSIPSIYLNKTLDLTQFIAVFRSTPYHYTILFIFSSIKEICSSSLIFIDSKRGDFLAERLLISIATDQAPQVLEGELVYQTVFILIQVFLSDLFALDEFKLVRRQRLIQLQDHQYINQNITCDKFNLIILTMDNPETVLAPETIYAYDTHRNIPWNDTEYQPVKQYLDPRKIVTERKYQETAKGGKDPNYVTRRGFYMDYHIKVVKALPSPFQHPPKDPFDQSHNKKRSHFNKLDLSLTKNTYLEQIVNEQKLRSTPSPGSYHLNKTHEQIEHEKKEMTSKKRYVGEKHFFYEDTQYLSNNLGPGSGNCNPHLQVSHLKMNKTTHKFWIDKHKKEEEKMKKRHSVEPAPGTHTPIPCDCITFDRIRTADESRQRKKDDKKTVFNGFGSDAKFEYTRASKKKIIEQRPAPCTYNMVLEWKGKNMELKKNNWIRSRSYGPTKSVYH